MKRRFTILNFFMSFVILFAILSQSVHSFEHLAKELTEKKCLHKHNSSKEITHQHSKLHKCFVCEFSFSSYISLDLQTIYFVNHSNLFENKSFYLKESTDFFSGIPYLLRGPPTI